jgi:hypothetical protein
MMGDEQPLAGRRPSPDRIPDRSIAMYVLDEVLDGIVDDVAAALDDASPRTCVVLGLAAAAVIAVALWGAGRAAAA